MKYFSFFNTLYVSNDIKCFETPSLPSFSIVFLTQITEIYFAGDFFVNKTERENMG